MKGTIRGLPRPKDRQEERPHPLRRRKGWGDGEVAGWPAGRAASGLEAGETVVPFVGSAARTDKQSSHACASGRLEKFFSVATQEEPNSGLFWPSPVGRPGRKALRLQNSSLMDLLERQARYARDTAAGRVDTGGVLGCRRRSSL